MSPRSTLRMGVALSLVMALAAGCGGKGVDLGGEGDDDARVEPDADPSAPDAAPGPVVDARVPAGCVMGSPSQCNNCLDDDNDGKMDGDDPECTGSADNNEGSFATGIPGDNKDERKQDCFFDGNSGGGQDCAWHTCCLLDNPMTATNECPTGLRQGYDPNNRAAACGAQTDACIKTCEPLTPPGCDCFGCCTVCTGATCGDILINPTVAPQCDYSNLGACQTCIKNTECAAAPCGGTSCVLCPGQTEADLPKDCAGTNQCPDGLTVCEGSADCTISQFCSNGCCIDSVD
jgi:hypothetical protein